METNQTTNHEADEAGTFDFDDDEMLADGVTKPRRDSLEARLERDQHRQLDVWLKDEERSYQEVRGLLAKEFGVKTSVSALCRYYRNALAPLVVVDAVKDTARWGKEFPSGCLETAMLARVRQLGYVEVMRQRPDVRAVKRLCALADTIERRQLARERMALEQRRVKLKEAGAPRSRPLAEWLLVEEAYRKAHERMKAGEPLDDLREALANAESGRRNPERRGQNMELRKSGDHGQESEEEPASEASEAMTADGQEIEDAKAGAPEAESGLQNMDTAIPSTRPSAEATAGGEETAATTAEDLSALETREQELPESGSPPLFSTFST